MNSLETKVHPWYRPADARLRWGLRPGRQAESFSEGPRMPHQEFPAAKGTWAKVCEQTPKAVRVWKGDSASYRRVCTG